MAYRSQSEGSGHNPFAFLRDDASLSWKAKAQTWGLLTDNGGNYPSSVEHHADGSRTFHYTDFEGNSTGSRTLTQGDGGLEVSRTEGALGSGKAEWSGKAGWSGSESLRDGEVSSDMGASVGGSASGSVAKGSTEVWRVDGDSGAAERVGTQGELLSGSLGGSVGTDGGKLEGSLYLGKGELSIGRRLPPSAEPRDLLSDEPKDIVFGQADGKFEVGLGGKVGGSLGSGGVKGDADVVAGADASGSVGGNSMGSAMDAGIFSDADRAEIVAEVQHKQLGWMNGPGFGRDGMQHDWDRRREQVLDSDHLSDAEQQRRLDLLDEQYGEPIRRYDELTGAAETSGAGEGAEGVSGGMSQAPAPEPWASSSGGYSAARSTGSTTSGQADFSSLFESIQSGLERVRSNIP